MNSQRRQRAKPVERVGGDCCDVIVAQITNSKRTDRQNTLLNNHHINYPTQPVVYAVQSCNYRFHSKPSSHALRTWTEVVKEDCQARKLNTENAMDRSK